MGKREEAVGQSFRRFRNSHRVAMLFSAAAASLAVRPASAQVTNWTAASSDWNKATNWSSGIPKTAGELVNITNTDAINRTITYDYNGAAVTLGIVNISNSGGGVDTLSMTTAGLTLISTYEDIGGYGGSGGRGGGAVIQTAGANVLAGTLSS